MDEKKIRNLAVSLAKDCMKWASGDEKSKGMRVRTLLTVFNYLVERLIMQTRDVIGETDIKAKDELIDILLPSMSVIKEGGATREEMNFLCAEIFSELSRMVIPEVVNFFKNNLLAAETKNPQRFDPSAKMTGQ